MLRGASHPRCARARRSRALRGQPAPRFAVSTGYGTRSPRIAAPYRSSSSYLDCQVVYMKPMTPGMSRAAASHCWKFVRSSTS